MAEIPRSTLEAMVKALRPPACKACYGTNFMEDGPPGATYSAPCTYCQDGVPNWAFDQAEYMLKAALAEGGVVLESQYSEMQTMAAMDIAALREAAKGFLSIAPISRGSQATDYSSARERLQKEVLR